LLPSVFEPPDAEYDYDETYLHGRQAAMKKRQVYMPMAWMTYINRSQYPTSVRERKCGNKYRNLERGSQYDYSIPIT